MLQYTVHPPPLSFSSNASKKSPQSGSSSFKFLSNDPSKHTTASRRPFSPSALTQKRPILEDIHGDRMPSTISLSPLHFPLSISPSQSSSSLPSPSFPSASLPKQVPRSSHLPSRPESSIMELSPALSSRHSTRSSHIEDVLSHGDLIGEGISLQGENLRLVPIETSQQGFAEDYEEPAKEFEVVRRLGTGSYAVVYLVREVLSRPAPSDDDHMYPGGRLELDEYSINRTPIEYGREYAIKLLSKADLDEEALLAQLSEATIHQSLPTHPNIVTLHRTLETSSFLLLLLEFVPGEDLFYFLEQARDHYDADPSAASDGTMSTSRTPPTPGLLSSLHPAQLLSHTRLRLIASMFSQMCEAVAVCHDTSVFHRDIKPENFIVTDGWTTNTDGTRERKVVVKLTDFGLSTTDIASSDMDCGSAPYMSYECRNNVAATYKPRAADVWSLGIVLINMLYHFNPWTDTAMGGCSSFDMYRSQPIGFLMQRFTGMTLPVANFLAENVFCILDDPTDDSQRVGSREFGAWVKDLPSLLGSHSQQSRPTHSRVASTASIPGHPLSSVPPSRRPSSRASMVSGSPLRPSVALARGMSRAPSLGPAFELEAGEATLSPVIDQEDEEEHEHERDDGRSVSRRSTSTKRRKRGARRKGITPTSDHDQTSDMLASASQSLARELSRASKQTLSSLTSPSTPSVLSRVTIPDTPPPIPTTPVVVKKPSKWKLSFGKSSGSADRPASAGTGSSPIATIFEPPFKALEPSVRSDGSSGSARQMSTKAANVSNLIMSLNAEEAPATVSRGRQPKLAPNTASAASALASDVSATWNRAAARSPGHAIEQWATGVDHRGVSPTSIRSGRPLASSASSMASSNWRSSMSSTNTSTSAFTKYSNPSMRSVSTYATSVSSSSSNWRNAQAKPSAATPPPAVPTPQTQTRRPKLTPDPNAPQRPPPNVKIMSGVPWELTGLPRPLDSSPNDNVFSAPPVRKPRQRKAKAQQLDTISERPGTTPQKPRDAYRLTDAATSTTDLDGLAQDEGADGMPKKVQKGQINALAKMLNALRR